MPGVGRMRARAGGGLGHLVAGRLGGVAQQGVDAQAGHGEDGDLHQGVEGAEVDHDRAHDVLGAGQRLGVGLVVGRDDAGPRPSAAGLSA